MAYGPRPAMNPSQTPATRLLAAETSPATTGETDPTRNESSARLYEADAPLSRLRQPDRKPATALVAWQPQVSVLRQRRA